MYYSYASRQLNFYRRTREIHERAVFKTKKNKKNTYINRDLFQPMTFKRTAPLFTRLRKKNTPTVAITQTGSENDKDVRGGRFVLRTVR